MDDHTQQMSRNQIFAWVSGLLNVYVSRIEQFKSGTLYNQIMDIVFPNCVPMSRVNWKAKHDYQFIANLKITQSALDKTGTHKKVDIEKLAKGKVHDTMDLINWLKKQFENRCGEERMKDYNLEHRRGNNPLDLSFAHNSKNMSAKSPKSNINRQKSPQIKSPNRIKSPPKPKSPQTIKPVPKANTPSQKKQKNNDSIKKSAAKSQQVSIKTQSQNKDKVTFDQSSGLLHNEQNQIFKEEASIYKLQAMKYKEQAKYTNMKLQTVKQIINGTDSDEVKLDLIRDIVEDIIQD